MNQELEIEFKNLLTKTEFEYLTNFFLIKEEHFLPQINYYFDSHYFSLKKLKSALRIRLKQNTYTYTLTLKQTIPAGILETHQKLTLDEAKLMLTKNYFPNGDIKVLLQKMNIPIEEITYLGALTTKRAEIPYKDGTLVFDHSKYLNCEDYELEYEVTNKNHGHALFINLLETHHIPIRKTKNKLLRFFQAKQNP